MRMMTPVYRDEHGHIIDTIRKGYEPDAPIVVTIDAGLFDQENFRAFEKLGIGYVCGGKHYKEFGTEKLPFKRFEPNTAFYYTVILAFNLISSPPETPRIHPRLQGGHPSWFSGILRL